MIEKDSYTRYKDTSYISRSLQQYIDSGAARYGSIISELDPESQKRRTSKDSYFLVCSKYDCAQDKGEQIFKKIGKFWA